MLTPMNELPPPDTMDPMTADATPRRALADKRRDEPLEQTMPLLWRFFPGHPNLLASWFEGEKSQIAAGESYVRKPIYSREGGNVTRTAKSLGLHRNQLRRWLVRHPEVVARDDG